MQRSRGTIRQRKDGRFEARLTIGRVDGKQVQRSFYAKTEREAAEKLEAESRRLGIGIVLAGPRTTVASYLRDWVASERSRLRPATHRRYVGLIEKNIVPLIGHISLTALTPSTVERMQDRAVEELHLSERTAHHMRTVLGTALALAGRDGLVMRNVAALARPRSIPHTERTVLNPEQTAALVAGVRGDRLEALFVLAIASGLRQGELLGLRWQDVDLTTGTLRVSGALQRIDGKLKRVEPKTQQSRRAVGLPANVVEVLRAHKARQNAERLRAGKLWRDGDYVFTRNDGQAIYGEYVSWRWHALRDRLGLPTTVSFHDLRHTAASLMLALGVDLKVIQTTLGHSAIRTTAETYTHVLPALQRDAADRMSVLFEDVAR